MNHALIFETNFTSLQQKMKQMLMKRISILLSIPVFMGVSLSAQTSDYPGGGAPATAAAVSPQDGSLWIGTAGDGLRRSGRNGKVLTYDAARYGLPIDTIKTLRFDEQGRLFLENSQGAWFSYTSVSGFIEENAPSFEEAPIPVHQEKAPPTPPTTEEKKGKGWQVAVFVSGVLVASLIAGVGGWLIGRRRRKGDKKGTEVPIVSPTAPPDIPKEEPIIIIKEKEAPLTERAAAVEHFLEHKQESEAPETAEIPEPAKPEPVKQEPEKPMVHAPKEEEGDKLVLTAGDEAVFCAQVEKLIRENLSDPDLNVEKIASILGISRIHVNRKMQQESGISPSTLITRLRMEKAAQLLSEQKMPIAEVATQVGFVTASYFSSAFRKYYGVTPKQFANKA